MSRLCVLLMVCAVLMVSCYARPEYQNELPNKPTVNGQVWNGVGHLNPAGGGQRNPFGMDFARAGHKWTVDLCKKDSDGDGFTNGQELGDPDCKWSKGKASPGRGGTFTHPGLSSSKPSP